MSSGIAVAGGPGPIGVTGFTGPMGGWSGVCVSNVAQGQLVSVTAAAQFTTPKSDPVITRVHYHGLAPAEDSELDLEIKHFIQDRVDSICQTVAVSKVPASQVFTEFFLIHLSDLLSAQLRSEVKFLEVKEFISGYNYQVLSPEKHISFNLHVRPDLIIAYPSRNNQRLKDLLDQAFPG